MSGDEVYFNGLTLRIKVERLTFPPVQCPYPHFAGLSAAALLVAAKHVNVYLTLGDPQCTIADAQGIPFISICNGLMMHPESGIATQLAWVGAGEFVPFEHFS